jgi:hypothetical protein
VVNRVSGRADEAGVLRSRAVIWTLVAALVAGTAAGAVGARWYGSTELHHRNARLADRASSVMTSALAHRAYYLQDVADMVGVHDDADVGEFSRYARVRRGNDGSVLFIRWLRRSPTGRLLPPREAGPDPVLLTSPSLRGSRLGTPAGRSRRWKRSHARTACAASPSPDPCTSLGVTRS